MFKDWVYADTDSVFLKKIGAFREDFESVKDALRRETGLPISLEYYFKFLVLLPIEADEKMEALKHYFGITHTKGCLRNRDKKTRRTKFHQRISDRIGLHAI